MSASDIVQRIYELEATARRLEATDPNTARLLRESAEMLVGPARRTPSDLPEATRERKRRQRANGKDVTRDITNAQLAIPQSVRAEKAQMSRCHDVTRDSVTSPDEGSKSVTRDQSPLDISQPQEPQEVTAEITEDVTRDTEIGDLETGGISGIALQVRGAEAALLQDQLQDQKHTSSASASLALVTPTRAPSKPPARSVAQITEGIAAIMASVSAGTEQRIAGEKLLRWKAEVAFAYWAKRTHHEQSLLDPQRERRLLARLRENDGNLHELLYCVDGAIQDDWIMGRDPKSPKKYDGVETIFRDRAQVERLAGLCPKWGRGEPHPLAVKYQALMGEQLAAAPQPQGVAHG